MISATRYAMRFVTMHTNTIILSFNLRSQEGMLRNLMIRTSSTGELMVLLQCKIVEESEMDLMKQLLAFVAERFSADYFLIICSQ